MKDPTPQFSALMRDMIAKHGVEDTTLLFEHEIAHHNALAQWVAWAASRPALPPQMGKSAAVRGGFIKRLFSRRRVFEIRLADLPVEDMRGVPAAPPPPPAAPVVTIRGRD